MGIKRSFEEFEGPTLNQPEDFVPRSKATIFPESSDKEFHWSTKSTPEHFKRPASDSNLTLFNKHFGKEDFQESTASPVQAKPLGWFCSGNELTSFVEILDDEKSQGSSLTPSKQQLGNELAFFASHYDQEFQGSRSCCFEQRKRVHGNFSSAQSLEEEYQESSLKESKQLLSCSRFTFLTEDSSQQTSQANDTLGEANVDFNKPHWYEELEKNDRDGASNLTEEELGTSALTSRATSSSSEDNIRSGDAFSSFFPGYFGFNVRRRPVLQVEDAYSSMLNSSPRRQVPIGPDHQADIPPCTPKAVLKDPASPNLLNNDSHLMGTCIISPLDSVSGSNSGVGIAKGRKFCGCFDEGSIRCVLLHVREAREKLKETVGQEKYEELGLCDMGEEIADRWTEEEERVFHEVIYSNPASVCKNFWNELSVVFPSRTNMEIVSYYFNVFILRRRAIQNRSALLEIDSDDDEWHGNYRGFHEVEEDEDSDIEPVVDQDYQGGSERDSLPEDDDVEIDDVDDNNEVDILAGNKDTMPEHDFQGRVSSYGNMKLHGGGSDIGFHNGNDSNTNIPGHDVQEEFNLSSESQQYPMDSGGSVGIGADAHEVDYFTPWLGGEHTNDSSGSVFLYETCDTKVWDMSCSTSFSKRVDIMPTLGMVDEIFGPFTPKRDQGN